MKMKFVFLVAFLMIATGISGYYIGANGTKVSFKDWKPAVVTNRAPPSTSGQQADMALFWTVWDKMNRTYVDKNKLDAKKMVDGAISGMVSAVGDPFTVYLPVDQNKASKEDLGGAFEGVGLQLGFKDSRLIVMTPLDGTPAGKAGLLSGDYILNIKDDEKKINRDTNGLSVPEAVKIIRGKKGSPVILTMFRPVEGKNNVKPFDVTLVRDTIVVKSVTMKTIDQDDKKIALLKLSRFGDRSEEEWNEAVSSMKADPKVKGMVLDLRNNPGGYLQGAVYFAGEFLPFGKVVVSQKQGDGTNLDHNVSRNGRLMDLPLVVLVNKGSASASEILSGALQDYKRAKIVGVQSFGKGSVQQPEDFPDGSGIHITIAKWLRPSGDWIDKVGITPDIEVKIEQSKETDASEDVEVLTDDARIKKDTQLQKALELLK